jgi:hypothetical protein
LVETETASIATLNMNKGVSTPNVSIGIGCTLTAANIFAGTLNSFSGIVLGTLNASGQAVVNHMGTGGMTTANVGSGAKLNYNGTGTITTMNLTGVLDMSRGSGSVIVTNCNLFAGWKIIDPMGRLIFTNPFKTSECRINDGDLDLGFNRTYQVT